MIDRRRVKAIYTELIEKIKDFLLSKKSREFLVFLFFVFVAGGFWLLQTLNNDFEAELVMPLSLKDVPENVVVTTEPVSQIQVVVKDKGTTLMNYMLGKNFGPVLVDFNEFQSSRRNIVKIPNQMIQKCILSQFSVSTKIISVSPDTIEYVYTTGESKRVPVRLCADIAAAHQYYISDTICTPDSVLVYAPEDVLKKINVASTSFRTLKNISDTSSYDFQIEPVYGAKFVPEYVSLTFPVDMYTEKSLEVPILGVNFPEDQVLLTFPSKVKVVFQVGLKNFHNVTPSDFLITVDYKDVKSLKSDKIKLSLKSYPADVSYVRIVPDEVDFLIEQIIPSEDD